MTDRSSDIGHAVENVLVGVARGPTGSSAPRLKGTHGTLPCAESSGFQRNDMRQTGGRWVVSHHQIARNASRRVIQPGVGPRVGEIQLTLPGYTEPSEALFGGIEAGLIDLESLVSESRL